MAKTCIICGQRAGSGEHTFPAALGGRRTNNGIYCKKHNEGFSPLVSDLSWQLKFLNALLAVRPDRKKASEAFEYTSPDGDKLIVHDGTVRRADPNDAYKTQQLHIQSTFGGPKGLRAISYIMLTFFAHHFQDKARDAGLDAIKQFITSEDENNFAWWETDTKLQEFPKNKFPFGHTIVLTTDSSTREAKAFISFFQSLNFGVELGSLGNVEDKSVVVFIDPHAERPPHDIDVSEMKSVITKIDKPNPLHLHLQNMIEAGAGQGAMQKLMNKIQRWKFENDMEPIIERLNSARNLAEDQRNEIVKNIVEEETSRIYRLMQHIVKEFEANPMKGEEVTIIKNIFAKMIELDEDKPFGVGDITLQTIRLVMGKMMEVIQEKLNVSTVDNDYMWELLNTGYGLGIVGEVMFAPVPDAVVAIKRRDRGGADPRERQP